MDKTIIKMKKSILTLVILALALVSAPAAVHNVKDYGAKGDGTTIDSPAINAAIAAAAADGGGMVYIPAGRYASYSVHLASHVHLYLEKGAVLLAAEPTETEGYDLAEPFEFGKEYQDYGHSHFKNSFIWGIGLEDITISGEGMIDGSGLVPGYGDDPLAQPAPLRGNKTLVLKDCRNVSLKDFTMYMCGHFALLATGVDNLLISNLVVDTQRDGFDIDCCRNVIIKGCRLNCPWDDAICLKASYALGKFKDTEEVVISDCIVTGYKEGTMLANTNLIPHDKPGHSWSPDRAVRPPFKIIGRGRIKFGTESSGGFRDITVTNCILKNSGGIFLETVDGGILEDVTFNNISVKGTNAPLFFRLGARMRSPEGTPVGALRRIRISDLNVSDADPRYPILISGIPGYCIEDVTLRNINIQFQGGLSPEDVQAPADVPEEIEKYPEYKMFGPLPAKGAYLRHIRGISIDGLHLSFIKPDTRPLFVLDDVEGLRLNDITVDGQEVN